MTRDKQKHFLVGYAIGAIASVIGGIFWGPNEGAFFGCIVAFVAGIWKEVYDEHEGGNADIRDLISTLIGGGLGAGMSSLIVLFFTECV